MHVHISTPRARSTLPVRPAPPLTLAALISRVHRLWARGWRRMEEEHGPRTSSFFMGPGVKLRAVVARAGRRRFWPAARTFSRFMAILASRLSAFGPHVYRHGVCLCEGCFIVCILVSPHGLMIGRHSYTGLQSSDGEMALMAHPET